MDLETKIRPICFASHVDSLIFGFYSFALTRKYESFIKAKGFDECVLAYRSDLGKCNIQFAKEVFDHIKDRKGCVAIALDIKGYFDNIDHLKLKEAWSKILGGCLPRDQFKLFETLTHYSYVNKKTLLRHFRINLKKQKAPKTLLDLIPGMRNFEKFNILRRHKLLVKNSKPSKETKRMAGIPQGSALSALLSNIFLIDFDKMMFEKSKQEGFFYRRYCDDIIIICDEGKEDILQ